MQLFHYLPNALHELLIHDAIDLAAHLLQDVVRCLGSRVPQALSHCLQRIPSHLRVRLVHIVNDVLARLLKSVLVRLAEELENLWEPKYPEPLRHISGDPPDQHQHVIHALSWSRCCSCSSSRLLGSTCCRCSGAGILLPRLTICRGCWLSRLAWLRCCACGRRRLRRGLRILRLPRLLDVCRALLSGIEDALLLQKFKY